MIPARRTLLVAGGFALFLGAFVWMITTHGPLAPVGVQTATVEIADVKPVAFGIGTVEARLDYTIGPVSPARVLRVLVDQGDVVKSGQLLAEMDPIDLDRRVQSARSARAGARQAVAAADAQVADVESRAKLARTNQARNQALYQQQVIPLSELDTSNSELESAEAALAAARAKAAVAKQDIERIDADMHAVSNQRDSLRLVSPADGVIVSRDAEPGTTVVAGQSVLRLVVPESLWVRVRIDQSSARDVQVGQPARITLRSSPDESMAGRVARIEMRSDPVTEERLVDVTFDTPPDRLYIGELAEVSIQLPAEIGVPAVPGASIVRNAGRSGVWRAIGGRAQFHPVEFGIRGEDGLARVRSGLNAGDPVVVYSSAQLHEGVRVRERKAGRP